MKSSTLHRASLSRERMIVLERARMTNMDINEIPQYNQQDAPAPELDVLYKSMRTNLKKPVAKKSPGVYLGIGFVCGILFMGLVSLIVGISSITPKNARVPKQQQTVAIIPAVSNKKEVTGETTAVTTEEKYTIKSGDTLDKIAFRFYGKYDNDKIQQIQTLNNITNPSGLQIGQVLIIPVDGQSKPPVESE